MPFMPTRPILGSPMLTGAVVGGAVLAAALAGCASTTQHATTAAAPASASASTAVPSKADCAGLATWNKRGQTAVKALYADTGAVTADAQANNSKAVAAAGRKLTSDAIAAATLPVPPVGAGPWKKLTAAYAAAGTALARGDATGAVPQLQEGNTAIGAFSAATARCISPGS